MQFAWCLQSQLLRARGELTRAQFLTGQPTQLIQLSEAHKRSQTCVLKYTEFKHVQKQTYHGDFFARPAPPRSYFRLFFQRGYLEHSRTPFCKMQYIFWVPDLPLAHLKRTCLARAIESMLQLVQKRGLFSLCSM